MTVRRFFVVLAALATLTTLGALPAAAHVELAESQPAAGSRVSSPPGEIYLRFTGPVQDNSVEIRVLGPDGEPLDIGETQSGARAAAAELNDLPGNGRYTVRYEGTSGDGHPFEGRFRFRLRVEQTEPDAAAEPSDAATSEPAAAATDAPTDAAAPAATPTSDTGASVPWAPIAAVIAIVVVAVAALLVRRRA